MVDHYPPFSNTIVMAGGLSAAAKNSLRAFWWTRQVLESYGSKPYDATHYYDQSGRGLNISSVSSISTTTDGADTAFAMDDGLPNKAFTRSDSLGISGDPALTIVWKCKTTGLSDVGLYPNILTLGTLAAPEFNLYFTRDSDSDTLIMADSGGLGNTTWDLPLSTFDTMHTYVVTKPANSGYGASAGWHFYIDGADQGSASVDASLTHSLSIAAGQVLIGDYIGPSYPFIGHLVGLGIFQSVLTGHDLSIVQSL